MSSPSAEMEALKCPKCSNDMEALQFPVIGLGVNESQRIWWVCKGCRDKKCDFPINMPTAVYWATRSHTDIATDVYPPPNLSLLPSRLRYLYPTVFPGAKKPILESPALTPAQSPQFRTSSPFDFRHRSCASPSPAAKVHSSLSGGNFRRRNLTRLSNVPRFHDRTFSRKNNCAKTAETWATTARVLFQRQQTCLEGKSDGTRYVYALSKTGSDRIVRKDVERHKICDPLRSEYQSQSGSKGTTEKTESSSGDSITSTIRSSNDVNDHYLKLTGMSEADQLIRSHFNAIQRRLAKQKKKRKNKGKGTSTDLKPPQVTVVEEVSTQTENLIYFKDSNVDTPQSPECLEMYQFEDAKRQTELNCMDEVSPFSLPYDSLGPNNDFDMECGTELFPQCSQDLDVFGMENSIASQDGLIGYYY